MEAALPPLGLETIDLLNAVVVRLLKAMRNARPKTVRGFFALANKHMRWELNDPARKLDEHSTPVDVQNFAGADPSSSGSELGADARRILDAIDALPEEEREALALVRIQGLTQPEAATILGVSAKTIQRPLKNARLLLTESLGDLLLAGQLQHV